MIENISNLYPKEKAPVSYFAPIDIESATKIKRAIGEELGIDLSNLPILILDEDHPLFRFFEVRNKLYQKFKDDVEVMDVLKKEVPRFLNGDGAVTFRLRKLAERKGVTLDGTFPGIVYTILNSFIMYPKIKEDKLIEMANSYAKKEQTNKTFNDIEEAKRFLSSLAEKYLAHEIGHIIYPQLSDGLQKKWQRFMKGQPLMEQRVRQVQSGNIGEGMSFEIMADEAFADTFGEMISYGHFVNRLGDFPEAIDLVKKIINKWQEQLIAENNN